MILMDSNVVSALMRIESEPAVASWLARQSIAQLFTTTPTIFEIRYGIEAKPAGRRRKALEDAFEDVIGTLLGHRIVDFDAAAAVEAGRARAVQKRRGKIASIPDSQIAGIALARRASIATGDIGDFAHLGIALINPWDVTG